MIGFRDAITLAFTKLRTRKVRLVVTIVVSGLLFSGLAGASSVARGAFGSINAFGAEGLGERFIVQANTHGNSSLFYKQEIIDRATELHIDLIARKKAEAKRLGITYEPTSEESPTSEFDGPGGKKQKMLNESTPAARQAMQEYVSAHPAAGRAALESAAATYGPRAIYETRTIPYSLDGQSLLVLKDGKEAFDAPQPGKDTFGPPTGGTESFVQSWSLIDSELLQPFLLPGQDLDVGNDGSIPIIIPMTASEQLTGTKSLPSTAKPSEKLEHTRKLREAVKSIRFEACYRNKTSALLIDKAVAQAQEIDQNKGKPGYTKPELIYGTPADACGAPVVAQDVRSGAQKTADAKQEEFDRIFGKQPASQQKYTFRIVGMVANPQEFGSNGLDDMIGSLVVSSLGSGWYTPLGIGLQDATIASLFPGQSASYAAGPSYQVELASATQTQAFMDKQNCSPDFSATQGPGDDPFASCIAAGKPFKFSPYGSNSLGLADAKRWFGKIFTLAALVVAGIAMIIMMGTVGRMIADSRRETAVFRAIGAKKSDIAQIYTLYTVFLALLISAFAVMLGLILSGIAHQRWSDGLTVQALVAYNAQDLSRTFDLYSLYTPDVLLLIGLALAGGIISATFPLIRNLRRNPIRDMRDDT